MNTKLIINVLVIVIFIVLGIYSLINRAYFELIIVFMHGLALVLLNNYLHSKTKRR